MFYHSMLWQMPKKEKKLYLTFDDGPNEGITTEILKVLDEYHAKATFFCLGKNVALCPELLETIKQKGHQIGNHTYSHLNGIKTPLNAYLNDIEKADTLIRSKLLRPPYGKISVRQIKRLKKRFRIVAWSVIAYDWDKTFSPEQCLNAILKQAENGSIIVLHDSEKAKTTMLSVLPRLLEHYSDLGYEFATL
jgi:Predicted xylanase/chitin deacetylase